MQKRNMRHYLFFISFLSLFLWSCSSTQQISRRNLSEVYKTGNEKLQTDFLVYHNSEKESTVHFQIDTKKLTYARQSSAENGIYSAKAKIQYMLFKSYDDHELVDSGSMQIEDFSNQLDQHLIYGKFNIPVNYGAYNALMVQITDVYQDETFDYYITIDKTSHDNRQNFLAVDPETNTPIFRDWFYDNEEIHIMYSNESISSLHIKYYNRDFDIAPPPFVVYNPKQFDYLTDNEFDVSISNEGYFSFKTTVEGFYHIQVDPNKREGFTLFHYNDGFPKINTPYEMVSALRFVTSKNEFEDLMDAADQKEALDKFWLRIANNPDRARELIKAYYNRVQNANIFFSCHKEGWKTDRGIVYIVFGPPDIVYKSSSAESWVYGEENNYLSVTFNFIKVDNPFSDRDYTLKRSPIYKNQWYRAVDSWRQGRVTSLDY